jgi:hypothetical protein
VKAWLRDAAGIRTPLTSGGLLLGRGSACGIVIDDPSVSRRHALLLAGAGIVQVLPLATSGIVVRGAPVHDIERLADGDAIEIGSARFAVELASDNAPAWLLGVGDRRYPVERTGFTVGGSADDDLSVPGWPDHACTLHPVETALLLEIIDALAIEVDGGRRDGEFLVLDPGARLRYLDTELVVVAASDAAATAERLVLPTEVHLELVPHGAVVRLRSTAQYTAFLPQRRGELVAALLRPSGGIAAGEWVDDDTLVTRVWGRDGASRTQVNVLIHRARQSLTVAGLNGPALLERAPGGGATRFRIAPGARVEIV